MHKVHFAVSHGEKHDMESGKSGKKGFVWLARSVLPSPSRIYKKNTHILARRPRFHAREQVLVLHDTTEPNINISQPAANSRFLCSFGTCTDDTEGALYAFLIHSVHCSPSTLWISLHPLYAFLSFHSANISLIGHPLYAFSS